MEIPVMSKYIAEIIGTAILVLLGDGVVANNLLNKPEDHKLDILHIHTGWGLAVFVAAMSTGWISGAHLNPAVTIALFVLGNLDASLVPGYIVSQFIGAFIGAVIVWLTYKRQFDETTNKGFILGTILYCSRDKKLFLECGYRNNWNNYFDFRDIGNYRFTQIRFWVLEHF